MATTNQTAPETSKPETPEARLKLLEEVQEYLHLVRSTLREQRGSEYLEYENYDRKLEIWRVSAQLAALHGLDADDEPFDEALYKSEKTWVTKQKTSPMGEAFAIIREMQATVFEEKQAAFQHTKQLKKSETVAEDDKAKAPATTSGDAAADLKENLDRFHIGP